MRINEFYFEMRKILVLNKYKEVKNLPVSVNWFVAGSKAKYSKVLNGFGNWNLMGWLLLSTGTILMAISKYC